MSTTSRNPGNLVAAQAATKPSTSQDAIIQKLEQDLAEARAAAAQVQVRTKDRFKIKDPEAFDGTKDKLRGFLVQMRNYHMFHSDSLPAESDRVLCTGSYLRGSALDWYEPYLKDYLENTEDDRKDETDKIFGTYAYFEERLRHTFGQIDEERVTERELI